MQFNNVGVRHPVSWAWLQLLGTVAVLGALAGALPAPWAAAALLGGQQAGHGSGPIGPEAVDTAMLLVASAAVWLLLLWAFVAAAAALSSRLSGTVGRHGRRVLARVAPVAARRLLLAAVGASMVTGVAACASGPAVAAGPAEPAAGVADSAPVHRGLADDHTVAAVQAASWITVEGSAVHLRPAARAVSTALPKTLDIDWPTADQASTKAAGVDGPAVTGATAGAGKSHAPVDIEWPAGRATAPGPVVVLRGDSLWSIAARHLPPQASPDDIDRAWHQWYSANTAVIGTNPNLILPGQILLPPEPGTGN